MADAEQKDPVRVLHLTDPHLFADKRRELRGVNTYDSLTEVIAHHRESGWPADIVLATGDLVQDDSAGAYEHFAALMGELGVPVHCIPGNHDVPDLMRSALADGPFIYCDGVEIDDWLIVGIDSTAPGRAGGTIRASELERLDADIDASDARHVLVTVHHPPVSMGSRWLDTVGLENGAGLIERVRKSERVRLVLFGHVHQAYDGHENGVAIVGTPSTCRQFKPKSDEFAVDDRPPAYRRLSLHGNGQFDSQLVWIRDA